MRLRHHYDLSAFGLEIHLAAHLALGQLVGRATIVRSKAANPLHVDLLGRGRQTGSRHVRDHSLTQLTIEVILRSGSRDTCPAFEDIPSITSSREACSNFGEAVQSNVFYVAPIEQPAGAAI